MTVELDSRLSAREIRRNTLILAACFASTLAVVILSFVLTVAGKVFGAHTVVRVMNRTVGTAISTPQGCARVAGGRSAAQTTGTGRPAFCTPGVPVHNRILSGCG